MNPAESGRATNGLTVMIQAMDKYNFKEPYEVSVLIEESDGEVQYSYAEQEEILQPANSDTNKPTTSMNVQNTNIIRKSYNTYECTQPKSNENADTSQTDSRLVTNVLFQEKQNPTFENNGLPPSYEDSIRNLHKNDGLNMLSKNLINILKIYSYYFDTTTYPKKSELEQKNIIKRFNYVKLRYFQCSRDVVSREILLQESNFNEDEFINNTILIARQEENFYCTFRSVQTIYKELIRICKLIKSQCPDGPEPPGKIRKVRKSVERRSQSYISSVSQPKHNNTLQISNSGQLLQPKQNYIHYNNLTQTSNYGPTFQHFQQNQYDPHNNNMMQNTNVWPMIQNNQNSTLHYYNINQNMNHDEIPNDPQCNNLKHTGSDGSILELPQTHYHHYPNMTQSAINGPISRPIQNDLLCNSSNIRTNNMILQEHSQSDQNDNNHRQSSVDQTLSETPTTCLYKYNSPNFEIRLDVNTQILDNVKKLQNDCQEKYQVHNTKECIQDDALTSPISHGISSVQEEPTRSLSRDSGFISPCINQTSDIYNNGSSFEQNSSSPYVIHVTSLNPKATPNPKGMCYICGICTSNICVGCSKYYYCSNTCQKQHWAIHKYFCGTLT